MKSPCKDCPERHRLCLDECEQYKIYKAERSAMSEAVYKENDMLNAYISTRSYGRKRK